MRGCVCFCEGQSIHSQLTFLFVMNILTYNNNKVFAALCCVYRSLTHFEQKSQFYTQYVHLWKNHLFRLAAVDSGSLFPPFFLKPHPQYKLLNIMSWPPYSSLVFEKSFCYCEWVYDKSSASCTIAMEQRSLQKKREKVLVKRSKKNAIKTEAKHPKGLCVEEPVLNPSLCKYIHHMVLWCCIFPYSQNKIQTSNETCECFWN